MSFLLAPLALTLIATAFVIVILYIKFLRYGSSREIILNLFCYLQGRTPQWIRDPHMAHRILQGSTTKGLAIEQLISYHAFLPVLSLESVDGEQWIRMKKNFLIFRAQLPPLQDLSRITTGLCREYLSKDEIIDSPCLAEIVFYSMLKWMFDIEPAAVSTSMEFVFAGILEWRKELAIKGKGDMALKLKTIYWMKKLIRGSKYEDLFGERWEDAEYWSLVLQPFFISPMINITDIAVTLTSEPFRSEYMKQNSSWNEQLLITAININHPFPVLERWLPDGLTETTNSTDSKLSSTQYLISPNTHVFLPMEDIGRDLCKDEGLCHSNSSWAAFGAGKRACAGRDIAYTLSIQIFQQLIPHHKFKPKEGHLYSGRDNDSQETISESIFQMQLLLKIIWRLIKKRLNFKDPLTSSSYSQIASKKAKFKNPSLLL